MQAEAVAEEVTIALARFKNVMESDYLKTLLLKSRGFGEQYKMKLRIDQIHTYFESGFVVKVKYSQKAN
ncbi:hypothetical protein JTB14_006659 [Gonioctena quinquepunctata]|nr:hypothetical protein JTB14_006659 [Gonioctena quinquepunctata]